ncbi:plasmid partition protein ParG [Chitinimonas sp. PSY-7]|uniref:plasmid partition protein ParG n=1 Tax=Chitinimonas sp. PSY-7 TaxID=3459088 RepID=UPI00404003A6
MTKKVAFGTKPTNKPVPAAADAWVESRTSGEAEVMKRLTIDIPEELHRKIKAQCALRGSKIADEVRELLLQKYGNS